MLVTRIFADASRETHFADVALPLTLTQVAIRPRIMEAMRTEEECDAWLTAPWAEAAKLQRPLPDGSLIVAHGAR